MTVRYKGHPLCPTRGVAGPFWRVRKFTARGLGPLMAPIGSRAKARWGGGGGGSPLEAHGFSKIWLYTQNSFSKPTVYWHYVVNIVFLNLFQVHVHHDTMKYWFSIQYTSPDDNLRMSIFTWYLLFFNFEIWVLREIPYIKSSGCTKYKYGMEWYKYWVNSTIVHETTIYTITYILKLLQVEGF